jgi:hypothetical protein
MATSTVIQMPGNPPAPIAVAQGYNEELQLAGEIQELWSQHVSAENTIRHTNEELRMIRQVLAKKLYEMKTILAKPGRNGKWKSFLDQNNIARATADRYVKLYEQLLNPAAPEAEADDSDTDESGDLEREEPQRPNRLSEAFSESNCSAAQDKHSPGAEFSEDSESNAPDATAAAPEVVGQVATEEQFTVHDQDAIAESPAVPEANPADRVTVDLSNVKPGDGCTAFQVVWPILSNFVTTQEAVYFFVWELTNAVAKAGRQAKGDSLLVFKHLPAESAA